MPATPRPRGAPGSSRGGVTGTPMSERQQMALLMQMTSSNQDGNQQSQPARTRDRNERGETALHTAAIKGDVDTARKLLDQGIPPNVPDFAGWTPLHEACNHGHYNVAILLVKAGADVNAKAFDDTTPLHDAAIVGNIKLVKMLIEKGADPLAKNRKGKTSCDVASAAVYSYLHQCKEQTMNRTGGQQVKKQPSTGNTATETKKVVSDENENENTTASVVSGAGGGGTKEDEDIYEFKGTPKDSSSSGDDKSETGKTLDKVADEKVEGDTSKRAFNEVEPADESAEDEIKRKKRKEDTKEAGVKSTTGVRIPIRQEKGSKIPGPASKTLGTAKNITVDRKSPVPSPKPKSVSADSDDDDRQNDGPKVPPLKIVIPQGDQDSGTTRNGKNTSTRNSLPYVVASSNNSNDSTPDKESSSSRCTSPVDPIKTDEKCIPQEIVAAAAAAKITERQPRVLRSSHRGAGQSGSADRSSNNSSPQLQNSSSPSPAATATKEEEKTAQNGSNPATPANQPSDDTASSSTSSNTTQQVNTNELHPRKRKIRASKEQQEPKQEVKQEEKVDATDLHPHDQPVTNSYQMCINLRKQIDRRIWGLFPVQPKPPQGFKDYLMNRRNYVLENKTPKEPTVNYPATLQAAMKELFATQEKERYKLRMQHIVEKEKLVLAVEQEILRVHGRAARALANQSLPFSVCSILKDQEVYNMITPEQEQKDMNARSRYNGRLFLSWLQDVDDKWEKIKEAMLLRHHNEAESLHAVQKMDWEWKLKEASLCEWKAKPVIEELHVPEVLVSDDFDLLPA